MKIVLQKNSPEKSGGNFFCPLAVALEQLHALGLVAVLLEESSYLKIILCAMNSNKCDVATRMRNYRSPVAANVFIE